MTRKIVSEMTYNVLHGTLNHTSLYPYCSVKLWRFSSRLMVSE